MGDVVAVRAKWLKSTDHCSLIRVVTGVYGRLMTVPYHHQLLSTRLVTLTIKCQSNQINQYSYKASSSKV